MAQVGGEGKGSLCGAKCAVGPNCVRPRASAVVAATIDRRFGMKGKAQGQKGTVRGYPLRSQSAWAIDLASDGIR
jgi:hypothetical protein